MPDPLETFKKQINWTLCWLLGSSVQRSRIFGGMISLSPIKLLFDR
jgi:hypothetical protein